MQRCRLKRLVPIITAIMLATSAPAAANDLTIGLTTNVVDVDANFSGAKIVLFGAVTGAASLEEEAGDIVAVIKGPPLEFTIRPIEKTGLIWTAGAGTDISGAPGLYITSATRALDTFTTPELQRDLELGAASLDILGAAAPIANPSVVDAIQEFIAAEKASGRYRDVDSGVSFTNETLFTIDVDLPPNTPVGDYSVEVFLIKNGVLMSADTAALSVRKVGVERQIYDLAHQRPLGYGVMCVAMSLLAGWFGAVAFRK